MHIYFKLNGKTFQDSLYSVSLARPRKTFVRNNTYNSNFERNNSFNNNNNNNNNKNNPNPETHNQAGTSGSRNPSLSPSGNFYD